MEPSKESTENAEQRQMVPSSGECSGIAKKPLVKSRESISEMKYRLDGPARIAYAWQQGYEEGYGEGWQQGYEEGRLQAALIRRVQILQKILETHQPTRDELINLKIVQLIELKDRLLLQTQSRLEEMP